MLDRVAGTTLNFLFLFFTDLLVHGGAGIAIRNLRERLPSGAIFIDNAWCGTHTILLSYSYSYSCFYFHFIS